MWILLIRTVRISPFWPGLSTRFCCGDRYRFASSHITPPYPKRFARDLFTRFCCGNRAQVLVRQDQSKHAQTRSGTLQFKTLSEVARALEEKFQNATFLMTARSPAAIPHNQRCLPRPVHRGWRLGTFRRPARVHAFSACSSTASLVR